MQTHTLGWTTAALSEKRKPEDGISLPSGIVLLRDYAPLGSC